MSDTPVLYETGMEGQKPCLVEMELKPAPARDREEYPFLLAMGRVLHQPEREPEIETVRGRHRLSRKEIVEIHPSDARDLKVAEGEYVTIQHAGGTLSGIASVHGTQRGIISITTLFGELITALESSKAPDPMLKLPSLPLLPVKVSRAVATVAAD
jgi:predicted molibdopterin-dependent oxidoreductase YjgC